MAGRTMTRTEEVYERLRADILGLVLVPGSRLPFAELVERYDSSTAAIREGLQRLVEQGLVVAEPQLGFRVTSLSAHDLIDLTEARCEIEGLALRLAIEHGDLGWESSVVATHHVLDRTPERGDVDAPALSPTWVQAHGAFHAALIEGCPNRRIKATAGVLRDAAELYRHWSFAVEHDRDTAAEHRAIVDAVLARDSLRAVELLRRHLDTTARLLLAAAPPAVVDESGA